MSQKNNTSRRLSRQNSKKKTAPDRWILRLYVAGQTPRGEMAINNLRHLCEEHLTGKYKIEIIDLLVNPRLARNDQIVATPTVVRRLPPPIRKVIGDLSNEERLLKGLQLLPQNHQKRQ